jgi:hypothetical protein
MFQFSRIIRVKRDSKAATTAVCLVCTVLPMPAATLEVPRVCSLQDRTWYPPHSETLHILSRLSAPTLTQTADNKGGGSNFCRSTQIQAAKVQGQAAGYRLRYGLFYQAVTEAQ